MWLWGHLQQRFLGRLASTQPIRNRWQGPASGQGLVVFTIDCRTLQHASRSLLKGLRNHLRNSIAAPATAR